MSGPAMSGQRCWINSCFVVPTVGIAGLTLGGGWGQLHGKFGLAVDNVIGADVVTADGRLSTANASENEDLFWGIRGGSGNVGVVTSIDYSLHEVGPIYGGAIFFPAAQAKEVLRLWREFCEQSPDELVNRATGATLEGTLVFGLAACYLWSRRRRRKAVTASQEVCQAICGYARPHDLYSNPKYVRAILPARTARLHQIKLSRSLEDDVIENLAQLIQPSHTDSIRGISLPGPFGPILRNPKRTSAGRANARKV